jgi:hypothetical protein
MDRTKRPEAYGVFKPVGHVIVSFADASDMEAALGELRSAGFQDKDVVAYSPEQMLHQADIDIRHAGMLASIGQELNLVKAHRDLAQRGHSFLVVKAPGDKETQHVADIVRRHEAFRAQKYGHMMIEELIEPGSGQHQVGESPDRGLDAQTWSGLEGDAVKPRAAH